MESRRRLRPFRVSFFHAGQILARVGLINRCQEFRYLWRLRKRRIDANLKQGLEEAVPLRLWRSVDRLIPHW